MSEIEFGVLGRHAFGLAPHDQQLLKMPGIARADVFSGREAGTGGGGVPASTGCLICGTGGGAGGATIAGSGEPGRTLPYMFTSRRCLDRKSTRMNSSH